MDPKLFAKNISVDHATQTLQIDWADGHTSVYPLEGLRLACPCAECAGGHENMGRPVDPAIFDIEPTRQWRIEKLTEVGYYAMQITWGDGHDTGIYRWESLRKMCPCSKCNPRKSARP